MPRIHCHYLDCVFIDEGYCSAAAVEFEPDSGCVTYSPNAETAHEEDWDEEDEEMDGWEETDEDDDEDDSWMDDDDEDY
jgi:hypothetical protein